MAPREKGTLRQEQAAETRRKLLASARKLFAEQGYANTPVRSINREIHMADGLLYHYFPGGKREILQVLVQESFQAGTEDLLDRPEEIDEMSLDQVLERLYTFGDGAYADNMDLIKILLRDCNALEEDMLEKLREKLRERHALITNLLRRRHERGEIRQMDFEMAANQLLSVGLYNMLDRISNADLLRLSDQELRRRLVDHTLTLWRNP